MNVSSRYWSLFYANDCVFSRNEQQKVYFFRTKRGRCDYSREGDYSTKAIISNIGTCQPWLHPLRVLGTEFYEGHRGSFLLRLCWTQALNFFYWFFVVRSFDREGRIYQSWVHHFISGLALSKVEAATHVRHPSQGTHLHWEQMHGSCYM